MKTFAKILTIALVVLLLAQLVLMFLPYFTFTPVKTLSNPDPVESDYSLQEYCWTKTAELEKTFKALVDDYNINDYAHSLVLTFIVGAMAVVFNLINGNMLVSQGVTVLWGVLGISCFTTNGILEFGAKNLWIPTVSIIIIAVAMAVQAARLVPYVIFTIEKNKRKKALAV